MVEPSQFGCRICTEIPRFVHENSYEDIREFREKINWNGEFGRCPECGHGYRWHFERETDIYSVWEDFILERLSPAKIVTFKKSPIYEDYLRDLPAMIRNWNQELDHPSQETRLEAAWALTEWYRRRDKIKIRELRGHHRKDVAKAVDRLMRGKEK